MKGKGKGQDPTSDLGWNSQTPYKGKGKGQKRLLGRREGSLGKGGGSLLDGA